MSALTIHSTPVKLRLSMGCAIEKVRPVAKAMRDFLIEHEVPEEEVMSCELALVEACNNAVLYADEEAMQHPVEIEVACDGSKIQLRIDDHTEGFEIPADVALPSEDAETGRGLFIIKSMMDNVQYFRGENRNSFIMTKLRLDYKNGEKRFSSATLQEFTRKLVESEQIINDMAEELSSCYETLSAIFRCGAELGKTNNLKDFSNALCTDLLQITGADWYVLRIIPAEDTRLVVFSSSDARLELDPLGVSAVDDNREVEAKAAASRRDVWFNSRMPLHSCDPLGKIKPDAIGMVHPFLFADNLMGTLTVGKAPDSTPFTAAQANVIHTFADFLAIQIVNARLQEEQLKSKLISRELEIAKTIQLALLPKSLPNPPGIRLAGFCESARQVGGDFYDVVKVSDTSLLLIIADVMGKGIPAAMFAAILRSLLRATPEFNQQPASLLGRVNRLLFEELSEVEMFITSQLIYVDLAARKIVAASAGHCPVFMSSPEQPFVKAVSPDGVPLGILPDATFKDQVESFLPNSRLLLYTDGLTDAQNGDGQFFGEHRLLTCFQRGITQRQTADELKAALVDDLKKFQGAMAHYDDQTFLILAEEETTRKHHAGENFISR